MRGVCLAINEDSIMDVESLVRFGLLLLGTIVLVIMKVRNGRGGPDDDD
mgnify:CR=1 FL=1